jgi:hypothetical protein
VRSGKVVRVALVHGRRQHRSALRPAGQSMGIGAAGERIAAPAVKRERLHPAGEIAAEQADQLSHGELGKRGFPGRLELGRQRCAE